MNEARPIPGGGLHPQQGVAPHPPHPAQPLHPAQPARPAPPMAQPAFRASVTGVLPVKAPPVEETESIELEEAEDSPAAVSTSAATTAEAPIKSKIHAFSVLGSTQKTHNWKRPTHSTGTGACRMRSFHGRLSEQGLEYLDNAINEWLDSHPDVDIKFVTSNVGQFDGKIKEPALILNVWY